MRTLDGHGRRETPAKDACPRADLDGQGTRRDASDASATPRARPKGKDRAEQVTGGETEAAPPTNYGGGGGGGGYGGGGGGYGGGGGSFAERKRGRRDVRGSEEVPDEWSTREDPCVRRRWLRRLAAAPDLARFGGRDSPRIDASDPIGGKRPQTSGPFERTRACAAGGYGSRQRRTRGVLFRRRLASVVAVDPGRGVAAGSWY